MIGGQKWDLPIIPDAYKYLKQAENGGEESELCAKRQAQPNFRPYGSFQVVVLSVPVPRPQGIHVPTRFSNSVELCRSSLKGSVKCNIS